MSHKQIAETFLRMAAAGRASEAFDQYATADFKHHNAHFPGDAKSLAKGMDDDARKHPDKRVDILHAVEDGDLVALHFRFDGDRIAELWDIAQPTPDRSPNQHGMF
jgi:predicted SnoaL-like aldol condensation-catalyzing enzyme